MSSRYEESMALDFRVSGRSIKGYHKVPSKNRTDLELEMFNEHAKALCIIGSSSAFIPTLGWQQREKKREIYLISMQDPHYNPVSKHMFRSFPAKHIVLTKSLLLENMCEEKQ